MLDIVSSSELTEKPRGVHVYRMNTVNVCKKYKHKSCPGRYEIKYGTQRYVAHRGLVFHPVIRA